MPHDPRNGTTPLWETSLAQRHKGNCEACEIRLCEMRLRHAFQLSARVSSEGRGVLTCGVVFGVAHPEGPNETSTAGCPCGMSSASRSQ